MPSPPSPAPSAPPGPAPAPRTTSYRLRELSFALSGVSFLLSLALVSAFSVMLISGMTWGYGTGVDTSAVCWIALVGASVTSLAAVVAGLAHIETAGREEWGAVVLGVLSLVMPGISWLLVAAYHR